MKTERPKLSRPQPNLELAMIGNCAITALIDKRASILWSCMPSFDGDPVFCALVNTETTEEQRKDSKAHLSTGNLPTETIGSAEKHTDGGFWDIELLDFERSEQYYIASTAVVVTKLYDKAGGALQVTDLCPRYQRYGRFYRAATICRMVEPLSGSPRFRVRMRPLFDYGATEPHVTHGSNHLRFVSPDMTLRLSTDAPISYITNETAFLANKKYTFLFGPDEPLTEDIGETGRKFLENTIRYWNEFVRGLALPFEYQDALIRSAVTLKMCTFEDTGGIVAAMTTSVPESAGSGRNWDYRYCWVRDSLFTVNALNRLGATRTMEDYLGYVMNAALAGQGKDKDLQPLYGLALQEKVEEYEAPHLSGYRGMGPVRVGNQAYVQVQNDVWGSVILALTQAFFDKRLTRPGTLADFRHLESYGESAWKNWDKPDAGIWEFRTMGRVHTFSAVMCWVACDRLARIAHAFGLNERGPYWREKADKMHKGIMEQAWNDKLQTFVEPFGGEELDASLLLLAEVGFVDGKDPKFVSTVAAIERDLLRDGMMYRHVYQDDFGKPDVAFTVCTFWFIDALIAVGRVKEAREKFEMMLSRRNHVGLLSEDMDFKTFELWGNFPQTYSMVGLINSGMRLSKSWHEAV